MDTNNPLSVSEINELIKTIAGTYIGGKIYVKGEISNVKKTGGNMYFSLKDDASNINGVFWKIDNNNFNNGDIVIISGKITFYTKQGTYQITANSIEKGGVGDINTKYQKMKDDFEKKMLFSKKRPFPEKIQNIALLTSTEGAALQDIMYVLKNNKFFGNVYIKNCIVQGNNCPKSVKDGIEYFNKLHISNQIKFDILVIARGGGSIEDLMGYSSEEVVKAIYESQIFTISAIGHEIDTMLSDFAADYRAPTPSIAGETIIKYQKKENDFLLKSFEKMKELEYSILSKISFCELRLNQCANIHKSYNPINFINSEIDRIETIKRKIKEKINHNIHDFNHEIDKLKIKNNMNNTKKIMKNGYAIITDENDNLIETANDFKNKIKEKIGLKIMFSDAEINLIDIIDIISNKK
jgi:exodeoxyribonuclease VII large subunit